MEDYLYHCTACEISADSAVYHLYSIADKFSINRRFFNPLPYSA